MNSNFVRQSSLGAVAGLVLVLGCARPAAEPEQPRAVVAPPAVVLAQVPAVAVEPGPVTPAITAPVVAPPAPVVPTSPLPPVPPVAVVNTNAPAILQRIAPGVRPENVALTPALSEVVKLAQAGVGEEVILTYVDKSPVSFS